MKERVNNIEKKNEAFSKQTPAECDIQVICEECNFEAKYKSELSWHLSKNHGWPSDPKLDDWDMSEEPRYCNKSDWKRVSAKDGYDVDAHGWTEHGQSIKNMHLKLIWGNILDVTSVIKHF